MKQTIALDILKSGKNVFITGSAGTGKTYLLNLYTQYLKERRVYPTMGLLRHIWVGRRYIHFSRWEYVTM